LPSQAEIDGERLEYEQKRNALDARRASLGAAREELQKAVENAVASRSGAEHHPSWRERFAAPPPEPENPTAVERMAWRLRTPQGKKLYGLRKQTPEPVFGIIKSVMGFRQFLLRGLDRVRGEWSLVTMAWNIKRMFTLSYG
jgi:hypothetical protein